MNRSTLRLCFDKLPFYLLPRYTKIAAIHDYKAFKQLLHRIEPYVNDIKKVKILDVGCGARAPFTILFHSLGARATGADLDFSTSSLKSKKNKCFLTDQSPKNFLVALITALYHDKVYYRKLQKVTDFPLHLTGLDLKEMNASQTAFETEEFDLVVSNAVFEHLKNAPVVLAEMKRIMKQNAIIYAEIHLFPSLTGGHNTLWSNPDTQQVILGRMQPWDHLRKQQYPIDPSLNKLRESEYHSLFSGYFEILDWVTEYEEPEHYLTPRLSLELSGYSKEELLKRSIVVIARKV